MSGLIEVGFAWKAALGSLAMMAVQGTMLAMVALLIVRGGRLRPAWQAAVWLVVLVKFVLPWGPSLPWSLADLIAMVRGDGGGAALELAIPAAAAAPAASGSLAPALGWLALAAVWLGGTVFVCARALIGYRAVLRAAHDAPAAPSAAQALLAALAARVDVRRPRLVVGDEAVGPHVVGVIRPVIVVPPALLDEPVLLRAALLHELAHIRRRDALGRFVQLLARAAFWFFPVVRLASKRLELAREAACDAWALEAGDISRPAYARLLVQMAQLRTPAAPALAAPRTLDARVSAVLGPQARARLGWVHRVALAAWIAVALGGARAASAESAGPACIYTPDIAEALRQAYPDADLDGNGVLSREEACDYQDMLRQRAPSCEREDTERLVEPLCCNCSGGAAEPTGSEGLSSSRVEEEGADR